MSATNTEVLSAPKNLNVPVTIDNDTQMLLSEGAGALTIARSYQITSVESAEMVAEQRNDFLKAQERLKAKSQEAIEPLSKTLNVIRGWFKPAFDGLEAGIRDCNAKLEDWSAKERARVDAENRAREEEARRARQAAEAKAKAEIAAAEQRAAEERRKAEESERARQAAEAKVKEEAESRAKADQRAQDERKAREEAERQALAAQARGDAEAAARATAEARLAQERETAAEEDRRRAAAAQKEQAEAAAKAAAATARANEAAQNVVTNAEAAATQLELTVAAAAPERLVVTAIAGQRTRKNWVPELADGFTEETAKAAIAAASIARPALLSLLEVKEGALKKQAQSLEGSMDVPGYVSRNRPLSVGSKK